MIAEKLGRLFEVGFNIGVLADIEYQKYENRFGDLYRQDLQKLRLLTMVGKIAENEKIFSTGSHNNLGRWSQYFILKGFFAGLNFFREYIKSTDWKLNRRKPEILYYQCSFHGDNAFGSYPQDRQQAARKLLSQILSTDVSDSRLNNYVTKYHKKGEFLQADTLILLGDRREIRIVCVDLSIFSVKSTEDFLPLDDIEVLRRMLMSDIKHIRTKSVFSNLRIDTGKSQDFDWEFSSDLKRYFTAFKRQDKETTKLIQAGAYAYSFYKFLEKETPRILDNPKSLLFNVVGYSDRNISSLCLQPKNINILATCAEIYQQESKKEDIKIARQEVLGKIRNNAKKSFQDGKKFINELSIENLSQSLDKITPVTHQEKIDRFFKSVDTIPDELAQKLNVTPELTLRDAHAELIHKALSSDQTYVFLTGNPGIGKTTAIAKFLKSHIDEGFLLLYVSPRTQVNIDLISKFKPIHEESLRPENIFAITTNSIFIKENGGQPTVSYFSNLRQDTFTKKTVNFIPMNSDSKPPKKTTQEQSRFCRKTEDEIEDIGEKTTGVLNSLCQGIYATISENLSNNIVATVSIQSLRKTSNGGDTLKHLHKIFKDAYNRSNGVIHEKMREISQRIKHLFIMIDEVTGDDSGVIFLHGVEKFLKEYDLTNPQLGFNTKVIVADASIVEQEVIEQHLSQTDPEPDKIYFRLAKDEVEPLSVKEFKFNKKPAIAINANSYPASRLDITYKVFLECSEFNEANFKDNNKQLIKTVQDSILSDLNSCLEDPKSGQILVYIQDIRRLQELIKKLGESRKFEQYIDYLEIHGDLFDENKSKVEEYKQDVKVVFMTSSASRGLSFPKAQLILVEIPRFQIERNLMEVIQVIYRARGEYWENGTRKTRDDQPKQIIFYLSDRAFYYPQKQGTSLQDYAEEKKLSLAESLLNIWDILLILKLSIMTRIVGADCLGMKKFMMIPIGGKSVSATGNTFSSQMTNLIRELKKEHRKNPQKTIIKDVYTSLTEIFKSADFVLLKDEEESKESAPQCRSYISLIKDFKKKPSHWYNQLDKLLNFGNIETSHLTGNLLVVPIHGKKLEETYLMKLESQIRQFANQGLVDKMNKISRDKDYPPNLVSAIKNSASKFIKFLNDCNIDRSQWFEQNNQNSDQYYAVPLFVFMSGELMSKNFKWETEEEAEETEFRTLLSKYVHYLYPTYDTLPIGRKYQEFPFIVFRSYSLEEMREKIYSDRYLLTSNELNILNLILCRDESPST